jgi:hypothetical protein
MVTCHQWKNCSPRRKVNHFRLTIVSWRLGEWYEWSVFQDFQAVNDPVFPPRNKSTIRACYEIKHMFYSIWEKSSTHLLRSPRGKGCHSHKSSSFSGDIWYAFSNRLHSQEHTLRVTEDDTARKNLHWVLISHAAIAGQGNRFNRKNHVRIFRYVKLQFQ